METCFKVIIAFIGVLFFTRAEAQGLVDLELYGGLNINYFEMGQFSNLQDTELSSRLGQHAGANLLPKINEKWQLSLQGEWMRSGVHVETTNLNENTIYRNYGNYAIGARYNFNKGEKAFYVQPSAGISHHKYNKRLLGLVFEDYREVVFVARVEAGVKLYTRKSNYVNIGLRHQQGFDGTTPYGSEETGGLPLTSRNSYTGLFVGYGFSSKSWFKR
ncbi:hypothetical protein ACFOUP_11530 [Belliella kenyensis]|uniref:Outer membrane protein beta-barrel domain-containing protein n=1 Tax=Belliella kenyensis TaxID=1472724 RepID=A0ABV8EL20_9BACT|nr:hypothetical protein [Belliella kenyensis]MCH7400593.1 hypothetical protein [Belliella kenyensis]MDN3602120.1 hypothetical protein [Belliella kenyensis]